MSAKNFSSYENLNTLFTSIGNKLDKWTSTATVDANNQVTFTGLNDAYGYSLYCQNKCIAVTNMTITGSGTAVQIVYTVSGATQGDVCKLRIAKSTT